MPCTLPDLGQFYGTEGYFFNPLFRSINYTDGVKYVSDNGAAWLITDILAHLAHNPKCKGQQFISAKITTNAKERTAKLVLTDGNDGPDSILDTQDYPITDLEVPEIKIFFTDGVLLLASEY